MLPFQFTWDETRRNVVDLLVMGGVAIGQRGVV